MYIKVNSRYHVQVVAIIKRYAKKIKLSGPMTDLSATPANDAAGAINRFNRPISDQHASVPLIRDSTERRPVRCGHETAVVGLETGSGRAPGRSASVNVSLY